MPAVLEDGSRADEADAGDDLGGDAGGVDGRAPVAIAGNDGEQRGSQRHQAVGAEAGGLSVQLALEADDRPQREPGDQANRELDLRPDGECRIVA